MEWRAAELEKRRLQLKEANAERLRAMRCRVEEAEEQAVAMAAQQEDEEVRRHVAGGGAEGFSVCLMSWRACACVAWQTERRLAELEDGMAEETARALSELEGRMEQQAELARARVHEVRQEERGQGRMSVLML